MAAPLTCLSCHEQFDLQRHLRRRMPNGDSYCKQCLLNIAYNPDESPPLPQLPDDVLVQVFSWLPTRTLLGTVRAVCHKWRRLAAMSSVWCERSLDGSDQAQADEARVALSVAPRLHRLSIIADQSLGSMFLCKAAGHTKCAVSTLRVVSSPDTSLAPLLHEVMVARVVRRQVALHHLSALVLHNVRGALVLQLLEEAFAARLQRLDIRFRSSRSSDRNGAGGQARRDPRPDDRYGGQAPLDNRLRCGTLTSLTYESPVPWDPLLQYLVRTHADHLETLVLPGEAEVPECFAELIGNCSALRRVDLVASDGLVSLRNCARLRHLTLRLSAPRPALTELFTSINATQLETLRLRDLTGAVDGRSMELVSALASSRSAVLRELYIGFLRDRDRTQPAALAALPAALVGLHQLHTLHLENFPTSADLGRITPEVAPSLRWIGFFCLRNSFVGSACALRCRLPSFYSLVRRNPRLHVTGLLAEHGDADMDMDTDWRVVRRHDCDCCAKGLHPDGSLGLGTRHLSLYGHPEGERGACTVVPHHLYPAKCPSELDYSCRCAHVWLHVPARPR